MQDLIDFAGQPDVEQFIRGIVRENDPAKFQGVWIGRHPVWESMLALMKAEKFNSDGILRGRDRYTLRRWRHDREIPDWVEGFPDIAPSYEVPEAESYGHWDKFCRSELRRDETPPPFSIIFRLKPGALADRKFASILESALGRSRFFTAVEERPIPHAFAPVAAGAGTPPATTAIEGGVLIRAGSKPGTLGGFLQAAGTNDVFGITCAHVASVNDPITMWDGAAWISIGVCVASSTFQPHATCGANCYQSASAVDTDVALIKLHDGLQGLPTLEGLGAVHETFAPQFIPKSVTVVGGLSGIVPLETGKYGIWNEFSLNGSTDCQCYKELFELTAPQAWIGGPKFSAVVGKMIKPKDSGSFIVADSPSGGYALCGMAVGGDGISGYGLFIERALAWARRAPARVRLQPL